jgi:hypothetical protein
MRVSAKRSIGSTSSAKKERLTEWEGGNICPRFSPDGSMLPDFLQDLKNIGLSPDQLKPLFYSAEDYVQMWERAERAKHNVR